MQNQLESWAIAQNPVVAATGSPAAIFKSMGSGGGSRTTNWDHSIDSQYTDSLSRLNALREQFQNGKINPSDYMAQAKPLADYVQGALSYFSQYSGPAWTWAQSQGGDKFLSTISPEFKILAQGKSLFGRDLTQGELAQALPTFQGPNGDINGNAFLANLAQQYKANPSMDPGKAVNAGDAQTSVAQQFKSILGRDATSDELQHFTQAIQSGQTDSYGLGAFLKQMPEYTNAQDKTFRQGLSSELEGYDTREFNKEKEGVIADYARRGMSPGASPSLDYALTDLMGNIASNRSAYLANLSASQYGGNKDLAIGNYQNSLNQMYNQSQSNRTNQANMSDTLMNRGFEGMDYQTQMNDYLRMMSQYGGRKGPNPLYGAAGGLIGGAIGGFGSGGNPAAINAGYQMGSGAGNMFGYLNS